MLPIDIINSIANKIGLVLDKSLYRLDQATNPFDAAQKSHAHYIVGHKNIYPMAIRVKFEIESKQTSLLVTVTLVSLVTTIISRTCTIEYGCQIVKSASMVNSLIRKVKSSQEYQTHKFIIETFRGGYMDKYKKFEKSIADDADKRQRKHKHGVMIAPYLYYNGIDTRKDKSIHIALTDGLFNESRLRYKYIYCPLLKLPSVIRKYERKYNISR